MLRLRVRKSYLWGLDFLRLRVSTFYVRGLVCLRLGFKSAFFS